MDSFDYLDDLFEPVLIADNTESIVYYNPSFLTFFKVTPRIMNKQSSYNDFLQSVIPEIKDFLAALQRNQQMISEELTYFHEGQNFTVIVKGQIHQSGHVTLFFKDVTVEKQLNDKYLLQVEELKKTYAQVIQSDKLKVIGEMTANISHEINNPLTVAVGNTELISFALEEEDLNKQRDSITKFYKNINHSLDRINKIISNMKEFLHKSEDKKEYFEAKEIIEKAIAFVGPTLQGSPIQLKLVLTGKPPIILGNKIKLEQVFVNLIQNSIDALKESDTQNPAVTFEVSAEKNGNYIRFDIMDNGPGISPENREKIFETFFTTKAVGKGTGLGLSISHRIIESHQGKIELLDSKKGAHFRITLPAIGIAGHVSGNWERLISEGEQLKKILVVDNEAHILNLCMNFFSDTDFFFLGATSADEAIKELERTTIHVILTDLKMPNKDGEKFIRELRERGIDVPVLLMTSKEYLDKYHQVKKELKLDGIVLKPFTRDELISAVTTAVK